MSAKTVEKRRKCSWPLYLMLRKGIYKTWINSNKTLFHLSFTTDETKIQHISREKRRKDTALLEKANKPSGVMLDKTPKESYAILVCVHEDQALSMKCVYEWRFRERRESVSDQTRSGRPANSVSNENVENVSEY
ncbi:hypothetical protein TNCV_4892121 [Trichonephila clavipes]|nr:hypothetical protein TNCV_4892121 [Trichonephila clavipes]